MQSCLKAIQNAFLRLVLVCVQASAMHSDQHLQFLRHGNSTGDELTAAVHCRVQCMFRGLGLTVKVGLPLCRSLQAGQAEWQSRS